MNKRIEICGGIAAGKTSLARILEEDGYGVIYERFEDNPFLSKFYMEGEGDNTFETEMVFVLLHYNWIKCKKKQKRTVCDYSLFQDYCYAANNLNAEEMVLFEKIYNYLTEKISRADLIIYLKCNVDCLLQRIKDRNRKMEQGISREYLQNNIDVIERNIFRQDHILIIESDKYNFIKNDKEFVLEMIKKQCD